MTIAPRTGDSLTDPRRTPEGRINLALSLLRPEHYCADCWPSSAWLVKRALEGADLAELLPWDVREVAQ